jgi:hypothetical protein
VEAASCFSRDDTLLARELVARDCPAVWALKIWQGLALIVETQDYHLLAQSADTFRASALIVGMKISGCRAEPPFRLLVELLFCAPTFLCQKPHSPIEAFFEIRRPPHASTRV